MAKEKRSTADLDAELAALEAEIAALEGKKKGKKAEPPTPAPKRAEPEPRASPAADKAPPAPIEKKGRFALPKLGKKKAIEEPAAPAPEPEAPAPIPAEAAVALPPAPAPSGSYDSSVWRQDGDAWVRTVPETPVPIVRRVLDEEGNVVREEPAHARDVDHVTGVKAERGLGKLLRRK